MPSAPKGGGRLFFQRILFRLFFWSSHQEDEAIGIVQEEERSHGNLDLHALVGKRSKLHDARPNKHAARPPCTPPPAARHVKTSPCLAQGMKRHNHSVHETVGTKPRHVALRIREHRVAGGEGGANPTTYLGRAGHRPSLASRPPAKLSSTRTRGARCAPWPGRNTTTSCGIAGNGQKNMSHKNAHSALGKTRPAYSQRLRVVHDGIHKLRRRHQAAETGKGLPNVNTER